MSATVDLKNRINLSTVEWILSLAQVINEMFRLHKLSSLCVVIYFVFRFMED